MSHDPHELAANKPDTGHDESMDGFYADGYAAEREAARTAKYTVTFDVEYDPNEINSIATWNLRNELTELLVNTGENIVIDNVKVEER